MTRLPGEKGGGFIRVSRLLVRHRNRLLLTVERKESGWDQSSTTTPSSRHQANVLGAGAIAIYVVELHYIIRSWRAWQRLTRTLLQGYDTALHEQFLDRRYVFDVSGGRPGSSSARTATH